VCALSFRSEFRPWSTRHTLAIKDRGASRAELQPASDKTGDNAAMIRNILLAKLHDIWRTGDLILLGLSECRTCAYGQ
jgi:hypothetical protein